MSRHVLVIGATLLDTKGKPLAGMEPGTSNPAFIRHSRGGTARNVAENLGRLGAEVLLVSAVGDDHTGQLLIDQTAEAGVDVEHIQTVSDCNPESRHSGTRGPPGPAIRPAHLCRSLFYPSGSQTAGLSGWTAPLSAS
jgi:pseudouridine kinase